MFHALEEAPSTLAHAWRQFASAAGIRHPAGDPGWSGRPIGAHAAENQPHVTKTAALSHCTHDEQRQGTDARCMAARRRVAVITGRRRCPALRSGGHDPVNAITSARSAVGGLVLLHYDCRGHFVVRSVDDGHCVQIDGKWASSLGRSRKQSTYLPVSSIRPALSDPAHEFSVQGLPWEEGWGR